MKHKTLEIEKTYKEKSILIRHGTPDNFSITLINNPVSANLREKSLIVGNWLPIYPYDGEVELCRFQEVDIALQASEIVKKAIKEGWEAVDLMIVDNHLIENDRLKNPVWREYAKELIERGNAEREAFQSANDLTDTQKE